MAYVVKKKILLGLAFFVVFVSCEKTPEQEPPVPGDSGEVIFLPPYTGYVYKFRNLQNREIWKTFYTTDEIFTACQIPGDSLVLLSTEGLAVSCLFYPLAFTYTAYPSATQSEMDGIAALIGASNALGKLAALPDASGYLLKIYKNQAVPFDGGAGKSQYSLNLEDKCDCLDQGFVALLLAIDVFRDKLSDSGCRLLAGIALQKYREQLKYPAVYSWWTVKHNLTAAASAALRIARLNEQERERLRFFVRWAGSVDISEIDDFTKLIVEKLEEVL